MHRRELERQREIAGLEAQVYRLAELLGEQRAATRDNVQRKQARTGEGKREGGCSVKRLHHIVHGLLVNLDNT